MVIVLVAAGTEINKVNTFDSTPLHEACRYGHLETVKVLMSRDGLTQAEAVKQVVDFFKAMQSDIQSGGKVICYLRVLNL